MMGSLRAMLAEPERRSRRSEHRPPVSTPTQAAMNGRMVKNPTLIKLHGEVRSLLSRFEDVSFEHVPRELNRDADRLANRGVDEWLAGPGRDYAPAGPAPELFD